MVLMYCRCCDALMLHGVLLYAAARCCTDAVVVVVAVPLAVYCTVALMTDTVQQHKIVSKKKIARRAGSLERLP